MPKKIIEIKPFCIDQPSKLINAFHHAHTTTVNKSLRVSEFAITGNNIVVEAGVLIIAQNIQFMGQGEYIGKNTILISTNKEIECRFNVDYQNSVFITPTHDEWHILQNEPIEQVIKWLNEIYFPAKHLDVELILSTEPKPPMVKLFDIQRAKRESTLIEQLKEEQYPLQNHAANKL